MRIVLNADDFGASVDTVQATIRCVEAGALTSATIMVGMPATQPALAYAASRDDVSFGVHLVLASSTPYRPLTCCDPSSGLVDAEGRLLPAPVFRRRALARRIARKAIEREVAAQLGYVRDHAIEISHVDSHHHVHKLGLVRAVLADALPRFGIARVRSVQDVWLSRRAFRPTAWLGPAWRARLRRTFRTTDHFYMPTPNVDPPGWPRALLGRADSGPGTTLEVGVHPGSDDTWRAAEADAARALALEARSAGHLLVSWREI